MTMANQGMASIAKITLLANRDVVAITMMHNAKSTENDRDCLGKCPVMMTAFIKTSSIAVAKTTASIVSGNSSRISIRTGAR